MFDLHRHDGYGKATEPAALAKKYVYIGNQVRMAMELGLEIGSNTHIAGSLHMYKRDLDKAIERYKEENNV